MYKKALHCSRYVNSASLRSKYTRPGAGCTKLTTSLVNVALKFESKYHKYAVIFVEKNMRIFCKCNAKDSHIFPTKNNSVFDNVVHIY